METFFFGGEYSDEYILYFQLSVSSVHHQTKKTCCPIFTSSTTKLIGPPWSSASPSKTFSAARCRSCWHAFRRRHHILQTYHIIAPPTASSAPRTTSGPTSTCCSSRPFNSSPTTTSASTSPRCGWMESQSCFNSGSGKQRSPLRRSTA